MSTHTNMHRHRETYRQAPAGSPAVFCVLRPFLRSVACLTVSLLVGVVIRILSCRAYASALGGGGAVPQRKGVCLRSSVFACASARVSLCVSVSFGAAAFGASMCVHVDLT